MPFEILLLKIATIISNRYLKINKTAGANFEKANNENCKNKKANQILKFSIRDFLMQGRFHLIDIAKNMN